MPGLSQTSTITTSSTARATFETEPLSYGQMRERIDRIAGHFPWLVYLSADGQLLGYCYAHPWKEKAAYRYTLETTVYLSAGSTGKGVGTQLMRHLVQQCRRQGYRALIACITEGNLASDALHRKLGFRPVSRFEKVGTKFGRPLGENAPLSSPPLFPPPFPAPLSGPSLRAFAPPGAPGRPCYSSPL